MNKDRNSGPRILTLISSLCVLLCLITTGCSPKPAPEPQQSSTNPAPVAATPTATVDFSKISGRWVRTDGDYTLELRSMTPEGKLEAGYFNPNRINVAQATATNDGGAIKIFAELRDENYPGCLYKLTLVPDKGVLAGTYFQATMQETYDVLFERMEQ